MVRLSGRIMAFVSPIWPEMGDFMKFQRMALTALLALGFATLAFAQGTSTPSGPQTARKHHSEWRSKFSQHSRQDSRHFSARHQSARAGCVEAPERLPSAKEPVQGADPDKVSHEGGRNDVDAIGNRNVGCERGMGNWYSIEKQIAMGKSLRHAGRIPIEDGERSGDHRIREPPRPKSGA